MIHYLPDGRAYCDCGCEYCMMNSSRLDTIEGSDDRLATTHHTIREQSLIRALARAIAIVEMTDIDEAIKITAELEGDVALLVGGPIVLDCTPPDIIPLLPIPEDGAARKNVVIDFTAPENMGGRWLQPIRDAAEKLRRAARKQARKPK